MEGIELTQDRVLIERTVLEDTTVGGIILADSYNSEQPYGIVKGIGPEVMNLSIGDIVYYMPHGSIPVKIRGIEYGSIRYSDIVFVRKNF